MDGGPGGHGESAFVNAPEGMEGVYAWTGSESAKFLYNGDWVNGPVTTTAASVSAKFSQGSAEETVDVTFAAAGQYAGIQLAAMRPVSGAFAQFVLDTAVFAVEGVAITTLPQDVVAHRDMNPKGVPNVLRAEIFHLTEGGTFAWSAEPQEGFSFAGQTDDARTSAVTLTAGPAGAVTVTVAYDPQDAEPVQASKALAVYDPKLEILKDPAHDWVSVGETVGLSTTLTGYLGPPEDETKSKPLDYVADNLLWTLTEGEGEAVTTTGASTTVTLGAVTTTVAAALKVQRQGTQDEPIEMADATLGVRGVRLYIEGHDEKTVLAVDQEHTLNARIENAPGGAQLHYRWHCDKAEFRQGDSWVKGHLDVAKQEPECSAVVRFTEPGDEIKVEVSVDVQQNATVVNTLAAKRYQDASTSDLVDDPAAFLAIMVKIKFVSRSYRDFAGLELERWNSLDARTCVCQDLLPQVTPVGRFFSPQDLWLEVRYDCLPAGAKDVEMGLRLDGATKRRVDIEAGNNQTVKIPVRGLDTILEGDMVPPVGVGAAEIYGNVKNGGGETGAYTLTASADLTFDICRYYFEHYPPSTEPRYVARVADLISEYFVAADGSEDPLAFEAELFRLAGENVTGGPWPGSPRVSVPRDVLLKQPEITFINRFQGSET